MSPSYPEQQYVSQQTQVLSQIDSSKYPDTNKDLAANVQRLNSFVDYIGQYLQTMQKGIDQANQSTIQKMTGFAFDLASLLGSGGELSGIDLGNLQYLLPAIGAMFGFSTTTPFPVNLFHAAETLFLGYIVPLASFTSTIQAFVNDVLTTLGISPTFIDAVDTLMNVASELGQSVQTFINAVAGVMKILGVDGSNGILGSGFTPFQDLWHAISILLGGSSLQQLGALTDTVFQNAAPWLYYTAIAIEGAVSFVTALANGVEDWTAATNLASMFAPYIQLISSGFSGAASAWTALFQQVLTSAGIPGLDASKIISGVFSSSHLQPLIDAISIAIGGPANSTFAQLQTLISNNIYTTITTPIIETMAELSYLPVALLGTGTSANMVFNPGLDNNTEWTFVSGAVTPVYDSVDGHSNPGCISFTGTGTGLAQSNFIPVVPGQPVAGSCWYNSASTSSTTIGVQIGEYDVNKTFLRYTAPTTISLTGTTTWVETTIPSTYTVSPDANYIQIVPFVNFPAIGTCRFDDFTVTKSGSIQDYLVAGIQNIRNTIRNAFGDITVQSVYSDIYNAVSVFTGGTKSLLAAVIPGIDASKIITGLLTTSVIPTITAAMTSGIVAIDSLMNAWGFPGSGFTLFQLNAAASAIPHTAIAAITGFNAADIGGTVQNWADSFVQTINNSTDINNTLSVFQSAFASLIGHIGYGSSPAPASLSAITQTHDEFISGIGSSGPTSASPDPSMSTVFDFALLNGASLPTIPVSASTAAWGVVPINATKKLESIWWIATAGAPSGSQVYVSVYSVNTSTDTRTLLWESANIQATTVTGWNFADISSVDWINASQGQYYICEITYLQGTSGSSTYTIAGIQHNAPALSGIYPQHMGGYRSGATATSPTSYTSPTYSTYIPFFGMSGSSPAVTYQPQLLTYSASGSQTIPSPTTVFPWANYFDVAICSSGGGGGAGGLTWGAYPGTAGAWGNYTLTAAQAGSSDWTGFVAAGGAGGVYANGAGGAGSVSSVVVPSYGTLNGGAAGAGGSGVHLGNNAGSPGGAAATLVMADAHGNDHTYYGGSGGGSGGASGGQPGGAGAGGNGDTIGYNLYGGPGGSGIIYILAYQ